MAAYLHCRKSAIKPHRKEQIHRIATTVMPAAASKLQRH
jgi:hypothetical protein